jgi:hypothetical protein
MLPPMAKLFTLEEANALLPRLRQVLEELRGALSELERATAEAGEQQWRARGNGHRLVDDVLPRLRSARQAVAQQMRRVQELGCELKDPRSGLVDFPARRGGELVYLCWRLDESEVSFWHPLDTGFAGRQPL